MEYFEKRTIKKIMKPIIILPFAELDLTESVSHYRNQNEEN